MIDNFKNVQKILVYESLAYYKVRLYRWRIFVYIYIDWPREIKIYLSISTFGSLIFSKNSIEDL